MPLSSLVSGLKTNDMPPDTKNMIGVHDASSLYYRFLDCAGPELQDCMLLAVLSDTPTHRLAAATALWKHVLESAIQGTPPSASTIFVFEQSAKQCVFFFAVLIFEKKNINFYKILKNIFFSTKSALQNCTRSEQE